MPTQKTVVAFAIVSGGIMLIPGPSNFFLLAHGLSHGRKAAVAAMTGISAASALRVLMTALGLSAVLASSAVAYSIVRWAGVGYLVYLAVRALAVRSAPLHHPSMTGAKPALRQSARKGLFIGLGNPKMIIFFVAFFPQFIDATRGSQAVQILLLGSIFWGVGVLWDLAFACCAGTLGAWLARRPRMGSRPVKPRIEGVAYLGLAAWAAIHTT